jgi:hypothetical protein
MPIAATLTEQLQRYAILFEPHPHPYSPSSSARIAAENVLRVLAGEPPLSPT